MKVTKEYLAILKIELDTVKEKEHSIIDKYSTNYVQWSKACNKVNILRAKYNRLVRQYHYNKIALDDIVYV